METNTKTICYVLVREDMEDNGSHFVDVVMATTDKEKAVAEWKKVIDEFVTDGYETEYDEDELTFAMWEGGHYATDHCTLQVKEVELI